MASTDIANYFVDNIYYKVVRKVDNADVTQYGTGSTEAGYLYEFKFIIKEGTIYNEYPAGFKFRVEE